jgi:eukaryotic-like serine/threonine-protein kinase
VTRWQSDFHEDPTIRGPCPEAVIALRNQFASECRNGLQPRIEDYLLRVPEHLRARALREFLAVEVQLAPPSQLPLDLDDYRRRFPDYVQELEEAFYRDDFLAESADPHSLGSTVSVTDPGDGDGEKRASSWTAASSIPSLPEAPETMDGKRLGRYRIVKVLGGGAFGLVYEAFDTQLERPVALKVPSVKLFRTGRSVDVFLQEARVAAQLKHPGLVAVYDIQQTRDHLFIVQELIPGLNLAEWVARQRPSSEQFVRILIEIAEALSFLHQRRYVHRDVKPANVIIDQDGHAHVTDFGLTLHEATQRSHAGIVSGTPAYMSPEQVRGESHRLDGRSDLWSLGVILYEWLTGSRPFGGSSMSELYGEILHREPCPPRQMEPSADPELERICLKCLAKRQSDRYAAAADLTADLQHWLARPATVSDGRPLPPDGLSSPDKEGGPPRIIPRGLRAFGERDADFFLELLPGPRDREGLPESIRFWKTRLEELDADRTFPVGLVYGPSGCGKSSLMRAGLLPRLAPHVVPIYVEATAQGTELRLLKGLRKSCPAISQHTPLADVCLEIREGAWLPADRKVVLVIDQFEQWLHAHRAEGDAELIAALRHCNGGRVQALVMVRDDFWMSIARFMSELEIPLVEGHNSSAMDLFPARHAERVLAAFGRAAGDLPANSNDDSKEQRQFLLEAVSGISQEGKVVPVRLALFAEMVKGKPWTAATLKSLGGPEGVGVRFLDETFTASTALPRHRLHQKAAQEVLRALLPESGTDIKGHMRSEEELLRVSGYSTRPGHFADLLTILDSQTRLITPTEPEGQPANQSEHEWSAASNRRYYQLTHDFLTPALRDWLTRKQKETKRGRMELRLQERTALWTNRPERRQLPSILEWAGILRYTRRSNWNDAQAAMMKEASRLHGRNLQLGLACLAFIMVSMVVSTQVLKSRARTEVLKAQIEDLAKVRVEHVPQILAYLSTSDRSAWESRVRDLATSADPPVRARAALALSMFDEDWLPIIVDRLLACDHEEFVVLRDQLRVSRGAVARSTLEHMEGREASDGQRIRAAALLAWCVPESDKWETNAAATVKALMNSDPFLVMPWVDELQPMAGQLMPHLVDACLDPARESETRLLATGLVAQFCRSDPQLLSGPEFVELVLSPYAVIRQHLYALLEHRRDELLPLLLEEAVRDPQETDTNELGGGDSREARALRLARRLGEGQLFWTRLCDGEHPQTRTRLINHFVEADASVEDLRERLQILPPLGRQAIVLGIPALYGSTDTDDQEKLRQILVITFAATPTRASTRLPNSPSDPLGSRNSLPPRSLASPSKVPPSGIGASSPMDCAW